MKQITEPKTVSPRPTRVKALIVHRSEFEAATIYCSLMAKNQILTVAFLEEHESIARAWEAAINSEGHTS